MNYRRFIVNTFDLLPGPVRQYMKGRFSRSSRITPRIARHYDYCVGNGPFKGMRFLKDRFFHSIAPMLVGSFEKELFQFWDELLVRCPTTIIDIGAAEGFYAVGFARMFPSARIIAFEELTEQRQRLQALAVKNEVCDRLLIKRRCTPEELLALDYAAPTFILCDCEGYESELFTSELCLRLSETFLVIELHETKAPGVLAKLTQVFEATHTIELIKTERRTIEDAEDLSFLSKNDRLWAVQEHRNSPQHWMILRPKAV